MLSASYVLIHVSKFLELPDIIRLGSTNSHYSSNRANMLRQITKFTITRNIVSQLAKHCPRISSIEIDCELEQKDYDLLSNLPIEKLVDNTNNFLRINTVIKISMPLLKSATVTYRCSFNFDQCPLLTEIIETVHYGNTVLGWSRNVLLIGGNTIFGQPGDLLLGTGDNTIFGQP